jgi:tight adherence protein B
MTLWVITFLVFVVTAGLTLSAAYFMIEAPAARRRMRIRLASLQEASARDDQGLESQIVREEILSTIPALNRILLRLPFVSALQLCVTQAAMKIPVGTVLLGTLALIIFTAVISFAAGMPVLLLIIVSAAAGFIPFAVIAYKRRRRLNKFEELFPDAIDLLARAVRAGHAFTTGFSLIANEMPDPIAGEFRTTFDQQNLGLPLVDALRNLAARVPLPDVRMFLAALTIQRETGGNLGEILDNLSTVIRERFKILRQVRIFTAEGRLSLYILTGMPPAAGVLMFLVNRDYLMRLFTDPLGHRAIAGAIVMQIVGYNVISRLVRIKV